MTSKLIVLWSNGSVDIVWMDKIASIRLYNNMGRRTVNINTVDRLRITFEFYQPELIDRLPEVIRHAERIGYDVIIDLRDQKIYESKDGSITKIKNAKKSTKYVSKP